MKPAGVDWRGAETIARLLFLPLPWFHCFCFLLSSVLANITLLVEAITIAVNATLACVTKGYYIKNVFYSRRPPVSFNPCQSLTQFQKIEDE